MECVSNSASAEFEFLSSNKSLKNAIIWRKLWHFEAGNTIFSSFLFFSCVSSSNLHKNTVYTLKATKNMWRRDKRKKTSGVAANCEMFVLFLCFDNKSIEAVRVFGLWYCGKSVCLIQRHSQVHWFWEKFNFFVGKELKYDILCQLASNWIEEARSSFCQAI